MDIKDLNKPQMILLVLLVSFVVSIATGISVVALMQPEPTTVTQTINKVIQHTIEKVTVPEDTTTVVSKKDTNNKEAIILTEDSPLVDFYSVPKILDENQEEYIINLEERKVIGKAVVVSNTGLVFVDAPLIIDGHEYQVVLDKNYFNLNKINKVGSVYILQVVSKGDIYTPTDDTIDAE